MHLFVFDNGKEYDAMKLNLYNSIAISPLTGNLVFFEKETGEVILEWSRVKSLEMQATASGWNLKLNRISDHNS